jgi:hypothetical protein
MVALVAEPDRRAVDLSTALEQAPADLADHVVEHGLAGLAHLHAKHLRPQYPILVDALAAARQDAWSQHLTTLVDLAVVAVALEPLTGQWAVVKGPALAERTYGRGDLRRYHDVDLLVHPAHFGSALDLLEAAGVTLLDRNWQLIRSSMRAELSLQVAGRTTVDLHWHLLNEAAIRRRAQWDMPQLLARAKPRTLGQLTVPVLDDVDALVHLAVHACLSGGHRLIWLKDLERQQSAFPVPMEEVERRARMARLWPAVHLALLRSSRTFDWPAPPHPPAWSRLNRRLQTDGFRTAGGVGGSGRTLAMGTREGVVSSVAAVAGAVAHHSLFPRLRRTPLRAVVPPVRPQLADLRRLGGTAQDRAGYLRAVAATVVGRPPP